MQRFFLLVLSGFLFLLLPLVEAGEKNLDLILRRRLASKTDAGEIYQAVEAKQKWSPKQTAIIVCDMWDTHHCYNAVQRVEEIAPRMNEVLEKSRGMGVLIIHAQIGRASCRERV